MRSAETAGALFALAVLIVGSVGAAEPQYGKVETFQPGKKYNCVPTADHKGWDCREASGGDSAPPRPTTTLEPAATTQRAPDVAPAASAPLPAPSPASEVGTTSPAATSAPAVEKPEPAAAQPAPEANPAPAPKSASLPAYLRAPSAQPRPYTANRAAAAAPTPAIAGKARETTAARQTQPSAPEAGDAVTSPISSSTDPHAQTGTAAVRHDAAVSTAAATTAAAAAVTPTEPAKPAGESHAESASASAGRDNAAETASAAPAVAAPSAAAPASASAPLEPVAAAPAMASPEPTPARASTASGPVSEPEAAAPAPATPASAPVAAIPAAPASGSPDFLALPGSNFVIELAHAASSAEVDALRAAVHPPRGELYEVRLRRDGGDWWLLLWGSFDSVDAARAARNELPAQAGISVGWPRRVAPLQAEVQRAGG